MSVARVIRRKALSQELRGNRRGPNDTNASTYDPKVGNANLIFSYRIALNHAGFL